MELVDARLHTYTFFKYSFPLSAFNPYDLYNVDSSL